jgi:hypothetical protein
MPDPSGHQCADHGHRRQSAIGTLGGTSFAAGKVALRWTPTSDVEVNVSADYTRERDRARRC